MMVDTGATVVALNSTDAERLGIDFESEGLPSMVTTASGTVPAYALKLDRVRIGDIEQRNVQAVVISGGHPPLVLLGQTFLSRVKIQDQGNLMVLQAKY
jgi:aspartyl protease family protein